MTKLSSIAYYVTDKISSNDISLAEYVTTDCILQNKKRRDIAANLPPQPCSLIRYQRGDVLIANIRPYLKKVWFADIDGGASPDVLVLRAKNGHSPNFLYAILLQDAFFDYVMQGTKGSKMPRGDKEQILRYEMPTFSCSEENIGRFFLKLDSKIHLNEQINQNLEAMAKQLYDYWFVQFDFPNKDGKPYKSSGGKMVWNDKLKREIPIDWHCGNLFEIAVFTNGLACQKFRPKDDEAPLPVIKIREMHDGISADTEEVTPNIPESVKVYNGDVLFSWSASLEVILWAYGLGGLNQHIFKVTSANDFPKSFYYFQLLDYVDIFKKMAEARKTTMGHITQDHLQQSTIAIPDNKDIADKFEELISPIFRQMIKLQEEILNLTKQRNELLPLLMNGQVSVNSDLSVYKEKMRGNTLSFSLNLISGLQLLQRQSIIILSEKSSVDKFQTKSLIILVVIILGAKVFVTVTWGVLLEETGKVFQVLLLVPFEVAAHNDNAPVGDAANTTTVFPKTDV